MSLIHIASANSASELTAIRHGDVQPNAVDLRLGKVMKVTDNEFTIDEENKHHRGSVVVEPDQDGYYVLEPGHYEIIMENEVHIGEGESGWVITRSTLNRNGVYITSGLYDSGYFGVMAGLLHVNCGVARIKQGTRIGQYICVQAETLNMYDGDYGHGKDHDQKYQ